MCRGSSIIGSFRAEVREKERERVCVLRGRRAIEVGRRKVYILRYDRHTKNHYCNVIVSLVSRRVFEKGRDGKRKEGKKRGVESEERSSELKLIEILNYCTKLSAGSS